MISRLFKALLITVLLNLIPAQSAVAADFTSLYTAGHADIAVGYDATDGLHFFYELSSTARVDGSLVGGAGASAAPSDVSVIVPESVLTLGHAALPAPFAGNALYMLSQTSAGAATRPFLGFGAEEIGAGVFVGDALMLTLTGVSNSSGGQFVLYTNGSQTTPAMNTADGLSLSDAVDLFAGGHDHFNLGFTAPGVYDLTFTASGALVGGDLVTTSAVFRFVVGNVPPPVSPAVPEPSALVMAGLGVAWSVVSIRRPRREA